VNIELRQKPIRPFFFWGSGTLSLFLILLDMLYLYFSISRCFIYVGTINGFFYDDLFIFFQEQILTLEDKGQHFFFCSMPTCWNQPTDQCVFLALWFWGGLRFAISAGIINNNYEDEDYSGVHLQWLERGVKSMEIIAVCLCVWVYLSLSTTTTTILVAVYIYHRVTCVYIFLYLFIWSWSSLISKQ
jgi:hypothetical protein